jgi:sugar phosphate isomerase/epimerase
MKLAFTTLGCPNWDMDTIISRAVEYGFDGVDFRGYLGELKIYELPEFTSGIEDTARRFADAGLQISCLSSSARVFSKTPEGLSASIEEVESYAEICERAGTPFIRIFGGAIGDTPRAEAIDTAAANLTRLVTIGREHGVQLLVETHDDWLSCSHLEALMEKVDSSSAGILWDTHHPYRTIGESPAETWAALGKWIRNTHWKDSYVERDSKRGYQLCLVGDGDIPLEDIFACLERNGYDGYLTLEWEKKWCPEIEEPEVAFPGYVQRMRELMKKKTR